MRDYHIPLINDFMKKIGMDNLQGKTILEIGADMELAVAQEFIKRGAKEVYCANPLFPDSLVSPDNRIKVIKDFGEKVKFENNKFDCIFGIALLEHVLNVEDLFNEVKRMLKPQGFAYLQGNPMYTCHCGHHIWVKTPEKFYKFCDEIKTFEPWEHLTLHTKEEYTENLIRKGLPKEHIEKIVDFLFSDNTSKFVPSKIIQIAKDVYGSRVNVYKTYELIEPNEYYDKVKRDYSEEDLQTVSLTLVISPFYSKILAHYKNLIKKIKIMKLVCQ